MIGILLVRVPPEMGFHIRRFGFLGVRPVRNGGGNGLFGAHSYPLKTPKGAGT
jgi:hypothetical protein